MGSDGMCDWWKWDDEIGVSSMWWAPPLDELKQHAAGCFVCLFLGFWAE